MQYLLVHTLRQGQTHLSILSFSNKNLNNSTKKKEDDKNNKPACWKVYVPITKVKGSIRRTQHTILGILLSRRLYLMHHAR